MPVTLLSTHYDAVKNATSNTSTVSGAAYATTAGQLVIVACTTDSVGAGGSTAYHSLTAPNITFTKCYERTGTGGASASVTSSLWYGITTGDMGDVTLTLTANISAKLLTVHIYSEVATAGYAHEGDVNNTNNTVAYDSLGNNGKEVIFFKQGGAEGGFVQPANPANGWTANWIKTSGTHATSDATQVTHQKIMPAYDGSNQTPDAMAWATGDRVYGWGSFYATLPVTATRRIFSC